METKLNNQQRLAEFLKLWDHIPGADTGKRLDWIEKNMGVKRKTAIIWRSPGALKPPSEKSLAVMRTMLRLEQKRSDYELAA